MKPTLVEVRVPTIHVYSDGSWRGLYEVLQDVLPQQSSKTTADTAKKTPSERPNITVSGGRFVDHGGLAHVVDGTLEIQEGLVTARANFLEPKLGNCRVAGDLSRVKLACDAPYAHSLPAGFSVEAQRIEAIRKPVPLIRLPGLKIRRVGSSKANVLDALFSGLAADIRVELKRNERKRWPTELKLLLPGGGEVIGRGDTGLDGLEISASVKSLAFGHAHEGVGGTLSGQYAIENRSNKKNSLVEGTGRLTGFQVAHRSLAEGMIGPMDLELSGRAEATIVDASQRWVRFQVDEEPV